MEYLLYVAVKLICYSAWCWVGLRWLRQSSAWRGAFGYGVLRLAIGVIFGVFVFFAYQPSADRLLLKYLVIYAPIRLVEWFIIAGVFQWRGGQGIPCRKMILWSLGGILVSFAADLASPEGVAGHFCVGRCLC